ncbi:MAG TPA: methyltransferase domain-containing protein [Nitrospirota bacterium]|nr:methyltransferase domain-containing protein [Nitrospirota bacterium]
MKEELLKILACPMCKTAPLRYDRSPGTETLTCSGCAGTYPVEKSIPHMLPDKIADNLSARDREWSTWSGKLENFIQWRKMTWNASTNAERLKIHVDAMKEKFVTFTGLRNSGKRIIDIGSGDGGMKTVLGSCSYFGVDPLLIEGCPYDFPMVRAVGEYLPFRSGSFDAAILNQVLDHCNSVDDVLEETMRVIGADGSIYVMQYIARGDSFAARIYNLLIKAYLAIKGVKNLDTKTRRYDRKDLVDFFRERFEAVESVEFSESQTFIRAARAKKEPKPSFEKPISMPAAGKQSC